MSTCNICSISINKKSPGLTCQGRCTHSFHGKCVGLTVDQLNLLRENKNISWKCPTCSGMADISATPSALLNSPNPNQQSESGVQREVLQIIKSLQNDFMDFKNKQNDLVQSVTFCSDKITDFELSLAKFSEYAKTVETLKNENTIIKNQIKVLDRKINNMEQFSRTNNIELQGIPEKNNENTLNIIQKVHLALGLTIDINNIDYAHRVQAFNSNLPKNIIVKYSSRKIRDAVLLAAKTLRASNPSRVISIDGLSNKIYINDHLSPENKLLFKNARNMARQKGVKYVWVKNGQVLARKDDTSKAVHLESEEDFNKI